MNPFTFSRIFPLKALSSGGVGVGAAGWVLVELPHCGKAGQPPQLPLERSPRQAKSGFLDGCQWEWLGFLVFQRAFCSVKTQERLAKGKGEKSAGLQGKGLGGLQPDMGGYLVWDNQKALVSILSSKTGVTTGCHLSIGLICWVGEISLCLRTD